MEFSNLPEEAKKILTETSAFQEGHFKLTSGLHSEGYLQCALILQHPELAEKIATELSEKFRSEKIDAVLTPAVGGIVLGQEIARAIGCRAIFGERVNGDMTLRRGFSISPGEKILLAEDVVTTGGSVMELKKIVLGNKAEVAGFTAVCNRSGGKFKPPEGLHPWISLTIETWQPEECPLCKKGLPIQKPGSRKEK